MTIPGCGHTLPVFCADCHSGPFSAAELFCRCGQPATTEIRVDWRVCEFDGIGSAVRELVCDTCHTAAIDADRQRAIAAGYGGPADL